MPTIEMPWRPNGSLELLLPADRRFTQAEIDIVWPDMSDPLGDYPMALAHALDTPVDAL
jgi:hypothetical protein